MERRQDVTIHTALAWPVVALLLVTGETDLSSPDIARDEIGGVTTRAAARQVGGFGVRRRRWRLMTGLAVAVGPVVVTVARLTQTGRDRHRRQLRVARRTRFRCVLRVHERQVPRPFLTRDVHYERGCEPGIRIRGRRVTADARLRRRVLMVTGLAVRRLAHPDLATGIRRRVAPHARDARVHRVRERPPGDLRGHTRWREQGEKNRSDHRDQPAGPEGVEDLRINPHSHRMVWFSRIASGQPRKVANPPPPPGAVSWCLPAQL
jgi:hypothetical protein